MYVYIRSERELWTVGFYSPDGTWNPESDHTDHEKAAQRVAWLNGSGKNHEDCDASEVVRRYLQSKIDLY